LAGEGRAQNIFPIVKKTSGKHKEWDTEDMFVKGGEVVDRGRVAEELLGASDDSGTLGGPEKKSKEEKITGQGPRAWGGCRRGL